MPRILPPPHGFGITNRVFDRRPEYAVSIATIIHSWAWLEREMADLMSFMQTGRFEVSMATYNILGSLELRLSALREVAKLTLPKDFQDELTKLSLKIRKVAKKRNAVAHSLWAEAHEHDGIVRLPHYSEIMADKNQPELWKIDDFTAVETQVIIMFASFRQFGVRTRDHFHTQAEGQQQSAAPRRGPGAKRALNKTNPRERPPSPQGEGEK